MNEDKIVILKLLTTVRILHTQENLRKWVCTILSTHFSVILKFNGRH